MVSRSDALSTPRPIDPGPITLRRPLVPSLRRPVAAALIVALLPIRPALTADMPEHESRVTQAVRQQLKERAAAREAAERERDAQSAATQATRQVIERLQGELDRATARLNQQIAAGQEAMETAAAAATDVAALQDELKRHRRADALQAAADQARQLLETQQAEVRLAEEQLARMRRESFNANQAHRQALQSAEDLATQIASRQDELRQAADAVEVARTALEQAQQESIAAARALKDCEESQRVATHEVHRALKAQKNLEAAGESVRESIRVIREAARISGTDPQSQITELENSLAQLSVLRQNADGVVGEMMSVLETAEQQRDAASDALAAAEATRRRLSREHATQSEAHFAIQREVAALAGGEQTQRDMAETMAARETELESQISAEESRIAELSRTAGQLRSDWISSQRQADLAREPLGRFVSFSRKVAPILAQRCTACHNTRSAGGRLNLNSFAALQKGGESGEAIEPHDPDGSLLVMMVEDGSMPEDGEPLTDDQIAIIRQWIAVGAPLDAGLRESADLFDIMPEMPQPLPPPAYRVPIPVLAIAFSPDGQFLATSGYHEVLLWTTDGHLVRRITNVAQRVNDLEFTADGSVIVVAAGTPGQLGEVKMFGVADGAHRATLVRTTDSVYAIAISPDGQRLAAAGADRAIHIVDLTAGAVMLTIEQHADAVMDVSWAPDGGRIVSASYDKSCRVFDAATGESVRIFSDHEEPVYTAAFLPDGKAVVSGGADQQLRIWPAVEGKQIRKIGGFGDQIFRLAVTDDGRVYSVGADRQIREHQLSDGKLLQTFSGHTDWVYALTLDAAGQRLATGSYDGEVRLWNTSDGEGLHSFTAIPESSKAADLSAQSR